MSEKDNERKRESRKAKWVRYRAKMSEENKERQNMRCSRAYYLKKGTIPREKSAIARWCREKGYSLEKVMSGEQPI